MFEEDKLAILLRRIRALSPFIIILVVLLLPGCGRGGDGSEPFPAKVLKLNSPSQYTDGIPLNPETDLDRFEISIKEDGIFSDKDSDMAAISAIDPGTGQPATYFKLANLATFLAEGGTCHVSIRSMALNGMKSGFSTGATFSF